MNDFEKFVSNAAVILAGWWVVHLLSRNRDIQKSRKELVAKSTEHLEGLIEGVLRKAQEYHRNGRNVLLEREIKMSLQDIAQRLSALDRILEDKNAKGDCLNCMRRLRQSITGAHFEDDHMDPLAPENEQFQEILDAVVRFKRGLVYLRFNQYGVTRP